MTSLRSSISTGIFYTAIARYSNIVISILITAILARILTPEEFGIVAIAVVFITFFRYLGDFGIGPAVIQNKTLTEEDIESIFTFSILFGLFLSTIFFFSASFISHFYDEPELKPISRVLSLSILFFSMNVVPASLNKKRLLFKKMGIIAVSIQLISGTVAVILAINNFSYYALIIKSLIDGLLLLVGNYLLSPIKLRLRIRKESILKIWQFSTYQFLFNFINYFTRNTDNLLIGKFFSPASLGFYEKAYALMIMPIQNLTNVITPVLHPILSEFQHDKTKILSSYMIVFRILATIGFPISVFFYFAGPEIISILYGSQWQASIPVFKILSTIVGVQIVLSSVSSIYQSANRTDLLFIDGLISSTIIVLGILYGVFIDKTLNGVAEGIVVAYLMAFFISYLFLIKGALQASYFRFLREMIMPLIISLGVLGANVLLTYVQVNNMYYSLMLKMLVSAISFAAIFLIPAKNRQLIRENIRHIYKRSSSKG